MQESKKYKFGCNEQQQQKLQFSLFLHLVSITISLSEFQSNNILTKLPNYKRNTFILFEMWISLACFLYLYVKLFQWVRLQNL